ncbi:MULTISPECIES: NmrA family NAD(P)-binding protein [Streptomyces]|uniref:NAD(P)H-binding protein n=1 Tax=Streptomyces sudanensis TaxID=436397 RepID=A0ABY4TGT3_9ACTN|nr:MULTISPECIES: NmrA family NAD(P)-binding protein [Streptomyces]URN17533.1 NAD(P)H-binding protein [Streptomyces sudanensis]
MSTHAHHTAPLLVIGGTGKTGRRVADRLQALGRPVRIGSRHSETPFVWEDESTWEAVLDGVRAAYVTYYPDLAFPGAKEAVGRFAAAAVERGARRLVLLSGRDEKGAVAGEDALKASGCDWTVVRANWFYQNFSESPFLDAVRAGELALPAGDATEPFVDADDIADVAVAALTDDRHVGRTYELSGPRPLSFHDVAGELSAATGRTIAYTPISGDDYRAGLREAGEPEGFADLFALLVDGRDAGVTHDVRDVLGREPRDFSDFAKETAATGTWDA